MIFLNQHRKLLRRTFRSWIKNVVRQIYNISSFHFPAFRLPSSEFDDWKYCNIELSGQLKLNFENAKILLRIEDYFIPASVETLGADEKASMWTILDDTEFRKRESSSSLVTRWQYDGVVDV